MKNLHNAVQIALNLANTTSHPFLLLNLVKFMSVQYAKDLGINFESVEVEQLHVPIDFTEDSVMELFRADLDTAIEKATRRGEESSLLYFTIIKGWLLILDNTFFDHCEYNDQDFGLEFFNCIKSTYL